jgi:hypothetical protein
MDCPCIHGFNSVSVGVIYFLASVIEITAGVAVEWRK